jgi:hypothetical protein
MQELKCYDTDRFIEIKLTEINSNEVMIRMTDIRSKFLDNYVATIYKYDAKQIISFLQNHFNL